MSNSLPPHGLCSPWNSPGQNTGVGSHSLLQGIFPTQGSNPGLPHHRQILHQLSHKECSKLERTCSSLNYSNSNIVLTLWTNATVITTSIQSKLHPGGASGEESTGQCRRQRRHWFNPWVRKIPWRRAWQPTPVFLPEKFHGH